MFSSSIALRAFQHRDIRISESGPVAAPLGKRELLSCAEETATLSHVLLPSAAKVISYGKKQQPQQSNRVKAIPYLL